MTRLACSALVALVMVSPLAAQKPITPPPETPIPERSSRGRAMQYAISVKGCIEGRRLKISASEAFSLPFDTLRASEFILDGPKELLQQIQERHSRHYDEIEGVVTVPPSPTDATTSITSKKIGPVRVGSGSHQSSSPVADPKRPLTLKVVSLTHLTEACVASP